MKRNDPIRAANRTVSRAVRAAEKQANFERLFRQIERSQRQAAKEAASRRDAAARFARIVTAPGTSKRERQAQFNRLLGVIEKRINAGRSIAEGGGAGPGGGEPDFFQDEWEEYESSLSYRRE